ncbi:MAG TPA: hypothetical protein VF614_11320 [Chthoniobacteraceae bacterium]|jgi:hypothetical protein
MTTNDFQDPEQKSGLAGTIKDKSGELTERADLYVRQNPVPAIIGAIAVGFALGLLARSIEPTRRHEPIRDCLDDTGDFFGSLFSPLARKSRHAYSTSSRAVRDAVDSASSKVRDVDVEDYVDPVVKWWKRLWS